MLSGEEEPGFGVATESVARDEFCVNGKLPLHAFKYYSKWTNVILYNKAVATKSPFP